jgi:hypothetical protein
MIRWMPQRTARFGIFSRGYHDSRSVNTSGRTVTPCTRTGCRPNSKWPSRCSPSLSDRWVWLPYRSPSPVQFDAREGQPLRSSPAVPPYPRSLQFTPRLSVAPAVQAERMAQLSFASTVQGRRERPCRRRTPARIASDRQHQHLRPCTLKLRAERSRRSGTAAGPYRGSDPRFICEPWEREVLEIFDCIHPDAADPARSEIRDPSHEQYHEIVATAANFLDLGNRTRSP